MGLEFNWLFNVLDMNRLIARCSLLFITILPLFACQKDNVSKLNGVWKITRQTDDISITGSGGTISESNNYSLSDSDLYLSFEIEESDNTAVQTGTATLSYGSKTSKTSFTYSPSSKTIAFKKRISASSVEVKNEEKDKTLKRTIELTSEFEIRELTNKKMVLGQWYVRKESSGGQVLTQIQEEIIFSLSKVN